MHLLGSDMHMKNISLELIGNNFYKKNRMKKLSSESQETIYFLTIFFTLENIILLLPSPNPCFVSKKHLGAIPSKSKICVQGFFNERQQEKNVRAKAD